jgi:hypothetical protein
MMFAGLQGTSLPPLRAIGPWLRRQCGSGAMWYNGPALALVRQCDAAWLGTQPRGYSRI